MPDWLIAILVSGILLTLIAWSFQWGNKRGCNNARLNGLESRVNNPPIRPECSEIFTEIKENLANLDGKMELVLIVLRKKQGENNG